MIKKAIPKGVAFFVHHTHTVILNAVKDLHLPAFVEISVCCGQARYQRNLRYLREIL